jgi:hypothetical protein
MDKSNSFWESWEAIRANPDPDPLEVLRVAGTFRRYFETAEREGIAFARAEGNTWEQIAEALGQSRQAVWQRSNREVASRAFLDGHRKRRWQGIRSDPATWYDKTRPFAT